MEAMMLSFPRPKPPSWIGLAAPPPPSLRRDPIPIPIVAAGDGLHLHHQRRQHHSTACRLTTAAVVPPSIWHAITPSSGCAAAASRASPRRWRRGLSAEEGSWNAASDARPARWLHGSDSAWMLFGVCSCFSPLNRSGGDQAVAEQTAAGRDVTAAKGKGAGDYKLIGMSADGRCLFRAVAYGACLASGKEAPDETQQTELADDLRANVVAELLKRHNEVERFVEEDFDIYIERIRQPYVWGGEPELLMASHVLQAPLSVFMMNPNSSQLINISNYGEEYKKNKNASIKVLFHGYGHYDALEILAELN